EIVRRHQRDRADLVVGELGDVARLAGFVSEILEEGVTDGIDPLIRRSDIGEPRKPLAQLISPGVVHHQQSRLDQIMREAMDGRLRELQDLGKGGKSDAAGEAGGDLEYSYIALERPVALTVWTLLDPSETGTRAQSSTLSRRNAISAAG